MAGGPVPPGKPLPEATASQREGLPRTGQVPSPKAERTVVSRGRGLGSRDACGGGLFVRSFFLSFFLCFVYSFIRSFVRSIDRRFFFLSFFRLFVHSFSHTIVRSFSHSFFRSLVRSFVFPFVRSYVVWTGVGYLYN